MEWAHLVNEMRLNDPDFPARTARIISLQRVLDGTQYDHLPHAFYEEENGMGEYVPLKHRRPSAKSNLCRTVVDDSISMLFGDGHMPTVQADDENTRAAMAHLMKEHSFGQMMMDAATKGSVGSIALRLRVMKNKPFFDALTTEYLTPTWQDDDPLTLQKVTEKRKVEAAELLALGYTVDPGAGKHWFLREWDDTAEIWYQPWPCAKEGHTPVQDTQRSLIHGLGFVPIVWIKNLPGGAGDLDGDSTFGRAIDTVVDLDYMQSQGGRGLRYSSDPTLVLVGPESDKQEGGSSRALVIAPEGDAKLLEINGSAAAAVKEHCKALRQQAVEQMHGNRADPEKMSAAQSGRAMELLNQSLISLCSKLRTSYGEYGLLKLLQMTCLASQAVRGGLIVKGEKLVMKEEGMWLKWPDWYPPTADDRFAEMNAFAQGLTSGVISRRTAVQTAMSFYSIQDLETEMKLIEEDMKEQDARQTAMLKAEAAAKPKPAAAA